MTTIPSIAVQDRWSITDLSDLFGINEQAIRRIMLAAPAGRLRGAVLLPGWDSLPVYRDTLDGDWWWHLDDSFPLSDAHRSDPEEAENQRPAA